MATGITKIKFLFMLHLNRLHCAKAHLVERLVDICEEPIFSDVKIVIEETIAQTDEQIKSLDRIYRILETTYSFDDCAGLVASLEDSFLSFQTNIKDPHLSYVLVLAYLYRISYIENAEKAVLQLLAERLSNSQITNIINSVFSDGSHDLIALLTKLYRA